MAGSRNNRLPYRVTLAGAFTVITAFCLSLVLFWHVVESGDHPGPIPGSAILAFVCGASLMGGALGAVIGQYFRDDRGGAVLMGAFVGALAGPPLLVGLLLIVLFVFWISIGSPSA